jgi:hypothetical protein
MNNEAPSPVQSLQIIQSMIEKTKSNLRHNSFFLLLWGWLVFITAITEFVLLYWVHYDKHYMVWNSMWLGAVASVVYSIKRKKVQKVQTYLGDAMKYFGMGLGILYISLGFIFSKYELWQFAFPVYILVYAFACFFMGSLMRFKPLQWGALACLIIMVVSVYADYQWQLLLMALAVLVSYIIPGHLLNKK